MVGNNTMKINQATMIVAMQEYLERRWSLSAPEACPKVTGVTRDPVAGTAAQCFIVGVTDSGGPRETVGSDLVRAVLGGRTGNPPNEEDHLHGGDGEGKTEGLVVEGNLVVGVENAGGLGEVTGMSAPVFADSNDDTLLRGEGSGGCLEVTESRRPKRKNEEIG